MVLLNFMLNVIPNFFLSFLKMLVHVWRKMVPIQRRFVWSDVKRESKISWISWVDMGKPKSEGGLGVRVYSLLTYQVLLSRCGVLSRGPLVFGEMSLLLVMVSLLSLL